MRRKRARHNYYKGDIMALKLIVIIVAVVAILWFLKRGVGGSGRG